MLKYRIEQRTHIRANLFQVQRCVAIERRGVYHREIQLVFIRAELVASRGEARRKAAEGALWLDGAPVTNVDEPFAPASEDVLLRFGKKRYRRVRIAS